MYRNQVVGLVRGYIPCIGWITIAFSEIPWLKQAAILACLFSAVFKTVFRKEVARNMDGQK